jgi:eukaryotic-like serine/threonine-protein kinase
MNPGDLLRNRYRIEKALAAGGFGETYLAVDLDYPGQPKVVVKHLKPQQSDPKTLELARRLFESEARVLAELGKNSDRIPTLHAYFEEQGEFYLVQEFIEGQTLTAELRQARGKLPEAQVIEILQEILAGLQEMHKKDKIHRDLKPDNIIRRAQDGQLVLIDFGAVKEIRQISLAANNAMPSATIPIGTKGYMPTEQAMGFPRLASDVYAVGAIGIQCLTGKHPGGLFDEAALALRWQHLCAVSSGLAALVEKMVEQHANDRYADGMEAGEAIEQFLAAGQPPTPKMPAPAAPTQQFQPPAPAPTQKVYVPPATPTVKAKNPTPANNPGIDDAGRRKLLKFLGWGGSGVVGTLLLARFLPKESSIIGTSSTDVKNNQAPDLSKISFASVRLDKAGKILEKPAGAAMAFREDLGNGVSLAMVKIPAGKFMMGQTASEKQELLRVLKEDDYKAFYANELPQHQVTLPEFYLGQTLVTQAQWQAIMGNNPASFKGDGKLPVDSVSWLDAIEFCRKLSQKTGRTYRLPSEAEWEYACRAGTTTPFAFGEAITPAVVNYNGNFPYSGAAKGEFREKTTPVGIFPANAFGLYDMHGNLWEWCLDEWVDNYNNAPVDGSARGDINSRDSGKQRLLRGGSWFNGAWICRSANRSYRAASDRSNIYGLRVVAVASSTPSRQNF